MQAPDGIAPKAWDQITTWARTVIDDIIATDVIDPDLDDDAIEELAENIWDQYIAADLDFQCQQRDLPLQQVSSPLREFTLNHIQAKFAP